MQNPFNISFKLTKIKIALNTLSKLPQVSFKDLTRAVFAKIIKFIRLTKLVQMCAKQFLKQNKRKCLSFKKKSFVWSIFKITNLLTKDKNARKDFLRNVKVIIFALQRMTFVQFQVSKKWTYHLQLFYKNMYIINLYRNMIISKMKNTFLILF